MNPTQSNGREKGIDILSRYLERRDIAEIRASIRKPLMYSGSSFLLTFPSFDSRRKEQQGLQDRTTPFHVLSARIPFRKVYITKWNLSTTKNSQLTFISTQNITYCKNCVQKGRRSLQESSLFKK